MNQNLGTVICVHFTHDIRDYFRTTDPHEQKNCGSDLIFNVKHFFVSEKLTKYHKWYKNIKKNIKRMKLYCAHLFSGNVDYIK